jgi:hypothetical protein
MQWYVATSALPPGHSKELAQLACRFQGPIHSFEVIGILVVAFVVCSFFADYKWRQWMAARRRDRQ